MLKISYSQCLDFLRKKFPKWQRAINRLSNRLAECLFIFILAFGIEVVFLFGVSGFWALYTETHVGQVFISGNPEITAVIHNLLGGNLPFSGLMATLFAWGHLALFGVVGQLTMLLRFFYLSRGVIGRVLLCGGPLAAWSAMMLNDSLNTGFSAAVVLSIIPTLILMHSTFSLLSHYLPEIDDLYRVLIAKKTESMRDFLKRKWRERDGEWNESQIVGVNTSDEPLPVIALKPDPARPDVSMALCGGCRKKMVYPNKYAGREVMCDYCGGSFELP